MLIKQNIAEALESKGEVREIFKQEIKEWVEKNVPNIKKMESLDSENCAEMRKLEDDYYSYISKGRKNKETLSEELLQLLKEFPELESVVLLKAIVYNNSKIREKLHPADMELFEEMRERVAKLYKQEN